MNRKDHDKTMHDILENNRKIKKLKADPTLLKEGQLQCFIITLKKQGVFDENRYENTCRVGSQPSRLYGTPKLHKFFTNVPPLRHIISSIDSFNYNLANNLCNILKPKNSRNSQHSRYFYFYQRTGRGKRLL